MQRYKKSIAPARKSYALFKIFMIPSRFFSLFLFYIRKKL